MKLNLRFSPSFSGSDLLRHLTQLPALPSPHYVNHFLPYPHPIVSITSCPTPSHYINHLSDSYKRKDSGSFKDRGHSKNWQEWIMPFLGTKRLSRKFQNWLTISVNLPVDWVWLPEMWWLMQRKTASKHLIRDLSWDSQGFSFIRSALDYNHTDFSSTSPHCRVLVLHLVGGEVEAY